MKTVKNTDFSDYESQNRANEVGWFLHNQTGREVRGRDVSRQAGMRKWDKNKEEKEVERRFGHRDCANVKQSKTEYVLNFSFSAKHRFYGIFLMYFAPIPFPLLFLSFLLDLSLLQMLGWWERDGKLLYERIRKTGCKKDSSAQRCSDWDLFQERRIPYTRRLSNSCILFIARNVPRKGWRYFWSEQEGNQSRSQFSHDHPLAPSELMKYH